MSFFSSEVVRAEMTEIAELQEQIYQNVFKFPSMSKEEKLEHVEVLETLLEKDNHFYEVIYPQQPVKPYFDLEIDGCLVEDHKKLTLIFINIVIKYYIRYIGDPHSKIVKIRDFFIVAVRRSFNI